ncbi:ABC transporter permease [Paenibacillus athensensis]|uniref:Peptide ABC transporter permease n=1 Tax=Paenibacillus athensensis TaxID=1967502 RepID=A0A4Y8PQZ5_9BACL|nr:ABC transporter permease [Paenibacillus athensensis]MCD1261517.1 ABC transporter permease [Paenibacillus athensensis]
MVRYMTRRLLYALLTLWLIATLTFVLMKQLPGDPLGEGAERIPQETRALLLRQYGLDKPLWQQYATYMGHVAHGDLGVSYQFPAQRVTDIIRQALPASLELGLWSLALAAAMGLTLGMYAAMRHNRAGDYAAMLVAVMGVAVPSMIAGPLLSYFVGVKLGWLPAGLWEGPQHRVLPALALSFGTVAVLARLMRATLLEVLQMDYIQTARAKGLSGPAVLIRHALRNALLPVLTIIGPIFVNVITGTLVVEQVFAVPGLGKHFVESVYANDYTMIAGLTIFYSALLIAVMWLTDVLYGWVDPRIRLQKGGA